VQRGLAALGIAVRAFAGRADLDGWLRITLPGEEAVFDRLCRALRAVLAPEAVLFDLDGVLADVSGSYRQAILQTAASYGVELSGEEIVAAKAAGGANNDWELTRRLLAAHGVEAPLDEVTDRFEALYQGSDGRPGLRLSESLLVERSWLARVAASHRLGVVTGRPAADAERFLSEHGVSDLFSAVVTMEEAPAKPDPAPVRLALNRLGVERAWLLGDTVDDARAARAAGVLPVGVVAPGDPRATVTQALLAAGAAVVLPTTETLTEVLP
jgi:HAD superfamily hydrolase (TIGR01548 family)